MKIIFFGTPEIAALQLQTLYESNDIEILSVFTQPDKPVGRKKIVSPSPVKVIAEKIGLTVEQPINKVELQKFAEKYQADFFVVVAYGMIFTEKLLQMPKLSALNVHMSLLPKYRGASPIQESLLNGDKETGISIIKMTKGLDAGPIYLLKRIAIEKDDNYESLSYKLAQESCKILPHALIDIMDGILKPVKQDIHNEPSYCRKITKEDGKINFTLQSAEEIKNMSRAYSSWPELWTELAGKKLKLIEIDTSNEQLPAGHFYIEGKILKIGTKEGSILPKKLQLEGKNALDVETFLNGYKNLILNPQ